VVSTAQWTLVLLALWVNAMRLLVFVIVLKVSQVKLMAVLRAKRQIASVPGVRLVLVHLIASSTNITPSQAQL